MFMFVNTSINLSGIVRNLSPVSCNGRSKRFCGNLVCWDSYYLSLIGRPRNFQMCNGRSRERNGGYQWAERVQPYFWTLRWAAEGRAVSISSGTLKLKKIQNILIMIRMSPWSPIWAQASLSTTGQMALTVNHRGVPMAATSPQTQPLSTQGQPAAAPATSPQGQLIAYRLAFAVVDAQSTAHVRA